MWTLDKTTNRLIPEEGDAIPLTDAVAEAADTVVSTLRRFGLERLPKRVVNGIEMPAGEAPDREFTHIISLGPDFAMVFRHAQSDEDHFGAIVDRVLFTIPDLPPACREAIALLEHAIGEMEEAHA